MSILDLSFASGETSLSVRRFAVHEAVSSLFSVTVWAQSADPSLDLETIVGQPAQLHAATGYAYAHLGGARRWSGIVDVIEQVQAEPTGLSTYRLRIVPRLWLLTQRRGYRIYQHLTIPEIIDRLLAEWRIEPTWQIARETYPHFEYKVQYGESDYDFFSRLLEEAGIAFTFPEDDKTGSKLTLGDRLHGAPARQSPPIPYLDQPAQSAEKEFVTRVRLSHEVRPGAHVVRDSDFRNPALPLFGASLKAPEPEDKYEQYHATPGDFFVETGRDAGTPAADDRGFARHDAKYGAEKAERAYFAERVGREGLTFESNVVDLWPGTIFMIGSHPHVELDQTKKLLILEQTIEGAHDGEWTATGHAVFTEHPYRPRALHDKPEVLGVQSAVVVGPPGQEIATDEFGRVRVQFPWDREGKLDDASTCWMRVSQGWGGTGYGMIMLPRIGQEVLVSFLDGDPDQPIVVGRLYNQTNPVPYKLPENKTISTWKSDSSEGSSGFNEIKYEDRKGDELFYVQAERQLRHLVKNDETITVLRDRDKHVGGVENDTTGVDRTEVTGQDRVELVNLHRSILIGGDQAKLVRGNEQEATGENRKLRVGKNLDLVTRGKKRELIEDDVHQYVKGSRRERVDGDQSIIIDNDRHEHVIGSYALETGAEIHLAAQDNWVGEAPSDVMLKGPGGFIRIDASGITIKGTVVKINVGGSSGQGSGAHPVEPAMAREAGPREPDPIDHNVTVNKLPGKTTVVQPKAIKPEERTEVTSQAVAAEVCELEKLEIECSHEKHKHPIKLPAAKNAAKPFDVLEVIAAGPGDGDKLKIKVEMSKPRCATHKGQAVVIRSGNGRWVKAEDTSTFEVTTHDIHIKDDFFRYIWPWNMAPESYAITAPACHHGGLTGTVKAYPALEASVDLVVALSTDGRVKSKLEKAHAQGRVEKRGRPAQTEWAFEIKGKVKYGSESVELGAKYESKIREWQSFNRLMKRAIDKFCELFHTFTGVVILPVFPNLSLSYGGKFKEIDDSYRVGAEWQISLKADPLIGLTFRLEILDILITALEKTQFAVIARFFKKVRDWAKDKGQTIELTLSFTGQIGGEVGAKKNAPEKKAGAFGSIEGKLKAEFAAKASFGSTGVVGFAFGAEAKANTGLSAKLALDNNATGLFLKGTFGLIACKFEYSVFASGKIIWEIKESHAGEYTFWEDKDLLQSSDVYILKNGP